MFEIDFLPVGEEAAHGDAIALRYTQPSGEWVHGVIDAGYRGDGERLLEHVQTYYETELLDFVLLTHPDADHVNGMGEVMRGIKVVNLLLHRPEQHGFPNNSGAKPASELVELAEKQGTKVVEPFAGTGGFDGTFMVAGPSVDYYRELLKEQETTTKAAPKPAAVRLAEALAVEPQPELPDFPMEVPFDDDGGTNPRNNSSAILQILNGDERLLFTGDAGVPAIDRAMDQLEGNGQVGPLKLFQVPHHGSRHNLDSETLDRVLGPIGQDGDGVGIVSVAPKDPKKPSPRITNACGRRGYRVWATADTTGWLRYASDDAPHRDGSPVDPIPPKAEPPDS
ncbi:MAG TPA: MBL fold metallo-hydrolase [Solirubrobacterales bacterium]|nr:MBL fold metallo-hydrolase [Solirubrobacterales bacterium]